MDYESEIKIYYYIIIKSRIHPLYIMQKRAIRICGNSDYRAHTRPIFYQFNICWFISKRCTIVMSITLGIIMSTLKIRFSRTTMKATSLCMNAPKMWNELCNSVKLCTSVQEFKHKYKILLLKK